MRFISEENRFNPYVITFCVSLLLSYLAVSTDNLLNHDAIYFMNSAKIYLRDGFPALLKVFPWPFYSWLVAVLHQVSFFPHIEQTAHVIDALFIAAVCVLFIKIYAEVTNDEGSLWVAAILILCFVGINKYRADVMKDFGYWLFYLAGFYCLLRYCKRPTWLMAVGWQIFTLVAFLFRIEGVVIMLLGPMAILLRNMSFKEKIIQVVPLYGVYIIGLAVALVALLFMDSSSLSMQLGRLPAILDYINIPGLLDSYDKAVRKIGEIYWYEGMHLNKYYGLLAVVYGVTLTAYVCINIVRCLSFPYFVVILVGGFKKHIVVNESNKIILYFIAFLFLFFCIYMIKGPVLSPRYTTTLAFMLLLLLGQIVERVSPSINASKHRNKIAAVVFIFLFISTADSVISTQGDSKTYVLNAGYWVKENTAHTVPVYSNYYKALYYTDRDIALQNIVEIDELTNAIQSGKLASGEVIMFQIKSEESKKYMSLIGELEAENKIVFLKKFINSEKDGLAIYKLK